MKSRQVSYRIDELSELFLPPRIVDNFLPLIIVRPNELIHLSVEVFTDTQFIVQDDFSQFLEKHRASTKDQMTQTG